MYRIPYPICAFAGLLLLAAMGTSLHDGASATASMSATAAPSSRSFDQLLQAGLGSRHDDGAFDIYSTDPLHPVAWLYVTDSTADGEGTEYLITTSGYVIPGPLATSVQRTTEMLSSVTATSLDEFLAWIVLAYDHVETLEDLEVFRRDVTPVLP